MKINTSIHDLAPLLKGPEILFNGLKETGINGIELVVGFKSRWSPATYLALSRKYNLPIVSLHQPVWSWLDVYFDRGFFNIAREIKIKSVVCHPLPNCSFQSKHMREYLKKLSEIQKHKGIEILLENMPKKYNNKLVNYFSSPDEDTGDIIKLYEAVNEFGLKMTLDIDHLRSNAPHKELWFKKVLPVIRNIHLSSFAGKRKHLPLYMGDFHATEFIKYLKRAKYKGLLTFEINSPRLITFFDYDFEAIKRSVELVRYNL